MFTKWAWSSDVHESALASHLCVPAAILRIALKDIEMQDKKVISEIIE